MSKYIEKKVSHGGVTLILSLEFTDYGIQKDMWTFIPYSAVQTTILDVIKRLEEIELPDFREMNVPLIHSLFLLDVIKPLYNVQCTVYTMYYQWRN